MQSLIKYSGSFAREAGPVRPGGCGKKSPFGGLGTMKPEPAPAATGAPRAQARLPHPAGPAPAGGRQLKRDPERPESAKAFGREGSGAQGEAEVRHPPVGIAVAVARQKDSGGSGRLGTGLADQERSLSLSNVKGESCITPLPSLLSPPPLILSFSLPPWCPSLPVPLGLQLLFEVYCFFRRAHGNTCKMQKEKEEKGPLRFSTPRTLEVFSQGSFPRAICCLPPAAILAPAGPRAQPFSRATVCGVCSPVPTAVFLTGL